MMRPLLMACLLCFLAAAARAESPAAAPGLAAGDESASAALARGEAAWRLRAAGPAARETNAPAAREALAAFERAHALEPSRLDARLRLLDALWFVGHFVETDRAVARRMFTRMTDLAEETVELAEAPAGPERVLDDLPAAERASKIAGLPSVREAHFWAAISWGLYGMSHGKASSGFHDVAGRIRDHAEILIALDERFADAGGLRLLGRLHAATPRVPLFTGWIRPEQGIELLERARAISTADPRNELFLGEALIEHAPARREEGLALLRLVAARTPDLALAVEQREMIDEARRELAAAEGGAP